MLKKVATFVTALSPYIVFSVAGHLCVPRRYSNKRSPTQFINAIDRKRLQASHTRRPTKVSLFVLCLSFLNYHWQANFNKKIYCGVFGCLRPFHINVVILIVSKFGSFKISIQCSLWINTSIVINGLNSSQCFIAPFMKDVKNSLGEGRGGVFHPTVKYKSNGGGGLKWFSFLQQHCNHKFCFYFSQVPQGRGGLLRQQVQWHLSL